MPDFKNDKRGFALAIMTALLPVLISLFLISFTLIFIIRTDQRLKFICRNYGLRGQSQVAPLLKSLMELNKSAFKLRSQIAAAQIHAKTGSPLAIARLTELHLRALTLQTKQNEIIRQSNRMLFDSHLSAEKSLSLESKTLAEQNPLFKIHIVVKWNSIPQLAVYPDFSELPPIYSTTDNFNIEQALAQSWQYDLTAKAPLETFLKGHLKFDKSCAVTLKKEGLKWIPQIIADKSLLKSQSFF